MKKRIQFSCVVIMLSVLMAWAAPVTQQQALQKASAFLQKRGLKSAVKMACRAPRRNADRQAAYYVFNNGDDKGFVIVSGDDRTVAIIGYSDTGSFSESTAPADMLAWLRNYAAEISCLDEHEGLEANVDVDARLNAVLRAKAPRRATETTRPVAPLLTSTWNQDSPYNDACPTFLTGNESVTGCVATAMAQVLYYHRDGMVTTLQADIPAYRTNFGQNIAGVTANGTTLDWANMVDNYTGSETDAQKEAVANLMAYCGKSVKMSYGDTANGGSGASSSDVAPALKKYFGIDNGATFVDRSQYSIAEWQSIIYKEVCDGRPVLYTGVSTGGGHAFVIDGYDGDGMFHVNWGWGGMCDGYFLLSLLNPDSNSGIGASSTTDGYSMGQDAIIGVQPNIGTPVSYDTALTAVVNAVSGTTVTATFLNYTGAANTYSCGLGIVTDEGVRLIKKWGYAPSKLSNRSYWDEITFSLSANDFSGMEADTYTLYPVCLLNGETDWQVCHHGINDYVTVVFDGTRIVSVSLPQYDVDYSDLTISGLQYVNTANTVSVTVTNNGSEFNGELYLFASKTAQKGDPIAATGIALASGASREYSFAFTPTSAGTYTLWLATDEVGNDVVKTLGNVAVTAVGTSSHVVSVNAIDIDNLSGGSLAGRDIKGTMTLAVNSGTEPFVGSLAVILGKDVNATGSYSFVAALQKDVVVDVSTGATIDFSFSGYEPGRYAIWAAYVGETSYTNIETGTETEKFFQLVPGIITMKADGTSASQEMAAPFVVADDVAAVDFSGIGISDVTPNRNPNTLYLFSATDDVPASLSGKNVVKGNTAATIALTDGSDFYLPKNITVDQMTYTRTFAKGTHGSGGWETLVLPFAPNAIMQGTQQLDWFRARTDADKNLWIAEFAELEGTTVVFNYAQQLEANHPYIIAVPDGTWGPEWDLRGKPLTFVGSNVKLAANAPIITGSDVFNFVGTTVEKKSQSGYMINEQGTKFADTTADVSPFRAFFKQKLVASAPMLSIAFRNSGTTAIGEVSPVTEETSAQVYDLQGRKVAARTSLPKGVYVVNGKKVVK